MIIVGPKILLGEISASIRKVVYYKRHKRYRHNTVMIYDMICVNWEKYVRPRAPVKSDIYYKLECSISDKIRKLVNIKLKVLYNDNATIYRFISPHIFISIKYNAILDRLKVEQIKLYKSASSYSNYTIIDVDSLVDDRTFELIQDELENIVRILTTIDEDQLWNVYFKIRTYDIITEKDIRNSMSIKHGIFEQLSAEINNLLNKNSNKELNYGTEKEDCEGYDCTTDHEE